MLRALITAPGLLLAVLILWMGFIVGTETSLGTLFINLGSEVIGIVITVAVETDEVLGVLRAALPGFMDALEHLARLSAIRDGRVPMPPRKVADIVRSTLNGGRRAGVLTAGGW